MTTATPSVTIIVPCYNAEATLERCIESLLAQTCSDFELILVNDGSSDRTGKIIDNYAVQDSRISAIHKSNGGVSTARNAALDVARGEYIVFADADDEIKPRWIDTFLSIVGNKDIAVQGIDFVGDTFSVKSIGTAESSDNRTLVSRLIKNWGLGYLFGKIFRRDIIEKNHIRFDPEIKFREDDIFVLHYAVYVKKWASTEQSNYVYYYPPDDKIYGSKITDCTEKVFKWLNEIFAKNIPHEILEYQAWSVKGAVVCSILDGKKLSPGLLEAYRITFAPANTLRQKILNLLILHSTSLGPLPKLLLRFINK